MHGRREDDTPTARLYCRFKSIIYPDNIGSEQRAVKVCVGAWVRGEVNNGIDALACRQHRCVVRGVEWDILFVSRQWYGSAIANRKPVRAYTPLHLVGGGGCDVNFVDISQAQAVAIAPFCPQNATIRAGRPRD